MIDKHRSKDLINYALTIVLFILAAIIIYPIAYSIIYGILLAYIFYPLYKFLLKRIKSELVSAIFVCASLLIILIALVILFFGTLFNQVVDFYLLVQKLDTVDIIRKIVPSFISTSGISETMISSQRASYKFNSILFKRNYKHGFKSSKHSFSNSSNYFYFLFCA